LRFLKDVALGIYFNPRNFIISKAILREIRPDVISYWNPIGISLSPIFAALKQKIPVIFHVSDEWMARWLGKSLVIPKTNIHVPNMLHLFFRKFKHQLRIIAISSYIKRLLLEQGFPSNSIIVVNYGVDTDLFKPLNVEKPKIFTILYVGQIVFHKGIHNVIIALAKILKKDKNVQLLIAGDGDKMYLSYLRRLIKLLGLTNNVLFLGKIPYTDLPNIYNEAHVFVYPSIYPEPQGMAILEAMACGVPVIASNIGGIPDMIKNNENGLLVKANDPTALVEAITRLKESPEMATNIKERGLKVIWEKFTWRSIAQVVLSEYEDSADRP
jgi:glycosyltransferase involved in cell wall biosynthesis